MDRVAVRVEPDRDLTVVTVCGIMGPGHVDQVLEQRNYGTTTKVLWDLRDASLSELNRETLQQIAGKVRPSLETRATRGTAIVANNHDAQLVIELYFEIAQHVFGRSVPGFATTCITAAMEWLEETVSCEQQAHNPAV
ncbi:MAG: hypothetical protein MI810_11250 [Flavobacteriales bacterium]|nr:hypothetical protein [Flavobacteriales bacterium]